MKKLLPILLVILAVITFSCDIGSEADLGTAPKVLTAGFVPTGDLYADFVIILYTDQSYDFVFAIEDPDLDVYTAVITDSGPEGYYFQSDPTVMASQTAEQMIYYGGVGMIPEPPYGNYQVTVQVTDEKNNVSNTFRVNYAILAP